MLDCAVHCSHTWCLGVVGICPSLLELSAPDDSETSWSGTESRRHAPGSPCMNLAPRHFCDGDSSFHMCFVTLQMMSEWQFTKVPGMLPPLQYPPFMYGKADQCYILTHFTFTALLPSVHGHRYVSKASLLALICYRLPLLNAWVCGVLPHAQPAAAHAEAPEWAL